MTPKKIRIHQIGRMLITAKWDKKGHWIKNRNEHTFHCWIHAGPSKDTDGTTCFNLIIGPVGLAIGWVKKPQPVEEDDKQWEGFQEIDPDTLEEIKKS